MAYLFFKLVHVLAVMLFLGNIITGVFWMHIAVATKDVKIMGHTMKGIITSDKYFTIPGVFLIILGGLMAAIRGHLPLLHTGWILWSIIMFSIAGFAFMFKVGPLQKKIHHLTLAPDFDWTSFDKLYTSWKIWGLIAVLAPLAAFAMMVLKIPQ